ncbi:hypothetical protein Droror1_Dr00014518 [Drosera rotundifolia]
MLALKDLVPAPTNNVNSRFIILDKGKPTMEGGQKSCLALVADETAAVHFQLWGEESDAFEPGDIVDLSEGIFSYNRRNLVLRAGRKGKMEKVGEFTMLYVETPNMSEIRWVSDKNNPTRLPLFNGAPLKHQIQLICELCSLQQITSLRMGKFRTTDWMMSEANRGTPAPFAWFYPENFLSSARNSESPFQATEIRPALGFTAFPFRYAGLVNETMNYTDLESYPAHTSSKENKKLSEEASDELVAEPSKHRQMKDKKPKKKLHLNLLLIVSAGTQTQSYIVPV